jgi:hypothetical protein
VLLTAGFTLAGPSTAAAGVRPEPCRDWSWSRLLFSRRRSLEAMSSEQPAGSPEVHPNAFLRALLTIRPGDGERAREGSPATGGRRQPGRPASGHHSRGNVRAYRDLRRVRSQGVRRDRTDELPQLLWALLPQPRAAYESHQVEAGHPAHFPPSGLSTCTAPSVYQRRCGWQGPDCWLSALRSRSDDIETLQQRAQQRGLSR